MPKLIFKTNKNVVLLTAGSGSRMGELTNSRPKSLLSVGNSTVLELMLDAVLSRTCGEVVVVTGFEADTVEQYLTRNYSNKVKAIRNSSYADDVNILSAEIGVSALSSPEQGYLIIETDLLLDDDAWDKIFFTEHISSSYWVCKGKYQHQLTGGILKVDDAGNVQTIDYQPKYNAIYDGWAKMIGVLFVGPAEVSADRQLRQEAISHSIKQYYLAPWCNHLMQLPCSVLDLAESFAVSFNTESEFYSAAQKFLKLNLQKQTGRSALQEQ